jgi:hypothetical protein
MPLAATAVQSITLLDSIQHAADVPRAARLAEHARRAINSHLDHVGAGDTGPPRAF